MKHLFIALLILSFSSCQSVSNASEKPSLTNEQVQKLDTATFAGGCFWCVEASFEQIKGVYEVVSGYSGGTKSDADYRKVSSGLTDHAEAVQVYYDPAEISYETLLAILFVAHDPTQLNRQGPDVGRQYRSAVFYETEEEKSLTERAIEELQSKFDRPIVTEVVPLQEFYLAEEYHQDYERRNPFQPYVVNVSKPKIKKVKETFIDIVKDDYK